jgi:hypothetical protein
MYLNETKSTSITSAYHPALFRTRPNRESPAPCALSQEELRRIVRDMVD